MSERVDVAVVGGGLVGSAAALALASLPLEIAVVEPKPPEHEVGALGFDLRVVALSPWGRKFVGELGAFPERENTCYDAMEVVDAAGRGHIRFDAKEVGSDALGYIVENSILAKAFWQRLEERSNVVFYSPDRVTALAPSGGRWDLELESGKHLLAAIVVAADGVASPVRTFAGGRAAVIDTGHVAVVTHVATELHHGGAARQWFHPEGPVALLPMPSRGENHHCAVVWSCRPALAQELAEQSRDAFCARLTDATRATLGSILRCDHRVSFPLRQLHAGRYGPAPGVVLIGDAAHVIHPLAGQGVNLGLRDVDTLVHEIGRVVRVTASLSEAEIGSMIRRYERRRWLRNRSMLSLMTGFKELFESEAPWVRWVRGAGMTGVGATPWLKRMLAHEAMGTSANR
ncbi:MAG: FAD-dependent monooxygenase [Pseudomonadales bacterium]